MPTCCVVIEGVFESDPAAGVIFHDATGIDDNAIAEVPKTSSARSRGAGLLHFARASQQNRTKMVGSRTGAPTLGSGGCSTAFGVALNPATIVTFPAPATSNAACGFPRTTLTCLLRAAGYGTYTAESAFRRSRRVR
jgi:hypothetical protein